jgi:hypothetical protein
MDSRKKRTDDCATVDDRAGAGNKPAGMTADDGVDSSIKGTGSAGMAAARIDAGSKDTASAGMTADDGVDSSIKGTGSAG